MDEKLRVKIQENYLQVLDQIDRAKQNSANQEVKVVVVSKTQSIEIVESAIAAGVTRFGENYAEEAITKMTAITNEHLEWHMIGHVQSRKANLVAEHFHTMHSLDSIKLGTRLNAFCSSGKRRLPVLLEVNVSGESSKYGFPAWDESRWEFLLKDFEEISQLSNLIICGLMTMPPYYVDPEMARPYFEKTRRLQEFITRLLPDTEWSELSMGTSNDFIVAIEEGATYVRIGEAILGKREAMRK